ATPQRDEHEHDRERHGADGDAQAGLADARLPALPYDDPTHIYCGRWRGAHLTVQQVLVVRHVTSPVRYSVGAPARARIASSARAVKLLTVPVEQPSSSAVCSTERSK